MRSNAGRRNIASAQGSGHNDAERRRGRAGCSRNGRPRHRQEKRQPPKLTALPGREQLRLTGDRLLRQGNPVGVLFIDLDNFKALNDRHGHHRGDRCLQRVVSLLDRTMGPGATLYRYGGDEFVVLLDRCDKALLEKKADAVVKSIRKAKVGGPVDVTASVGAICRADSWARTTKTLCERADDASYASKVTGKNKYTLAPLQPELVRKVQERRDEEAFVAHSRSLLLRLREASESMEQLCRHARRLDDIWQLIDDYVLLIHYLSSLVSAEQLKGAPFDEWRVNRGVDYLKLSVRAAVEIFVDRDVPHDVIEALSAHFQDAKYSSQRLLTLRDCCCAFIALCDKVCYDAGESSVREYTDRTMEAEKLSRRLSALTAALLPELRNANGETGADDQASELPTRLAKVSRTELQRIRERNKGWASKLSLEDLGPTQLP